MPRPRITRRDLTRRALRSDPFSDLSRICERPVSSSTPAHHQRERRRSQRCDVRSRQTQPDR
jgi:hypothetical protein